MATLKDSFEHISENSENLFKDYRRLFSIHQMEKIGLFLGILASIFIVSLLLFMVVVFCSIALAQYLNTLFTQPHMGYWIVATGYFLIAVLLVVRAVKTKTPLLTNLLIRLMGFVLEYDDKPISNLKDLRREKELVNQKIETDKVQIKSEFQNLRYSFMESLLAEFVALFKFRKKKPDNKPKTKKRKSKDDENETLD